MIPFLKIKKRNKIANYYIVLLKKKSHKKWTKKSYLISERILNKVLSLPISGFQSLDYVEKIVEAGNSYE